MDAFDLPKLAWRNLWRNRRRTLLTLVAISFGLFLAVMMTATQDRSFADMIDTAARMRGGHVTVQHVGQADAPSLSKTVPGADALSARLLEVEGVERSVRRISGPAMLATAGQSYGAFFIAFDPGEEDNETLAFLEGVTEGEMFQSSDDTAIVLGRGLARNLRVELGSKVVLTLMDKDGEIASGLYRVRGIIDSGSESTDRGIALLPLSTVGRALGYAPGEATELALFSDDPRRASELRDALLPLLPRDTAALTWDEAQAELRGFIAMKVGGARFMEAVIIVLVAASIFNTLLVSVMERTREFGVMLAIGWSPRQVFGLVMCESLWMALVGVATGGLLTLGPYTWLSRNPIDLTEVVAAQGAQVDIGGVGMSAQLAIGIFPGNLAIILLTIVAATLLSGLYPAWTAGRTAPVDSLKLV
jgi:ABC-type lipoprotein release transport system permease subunit